MKFKLLIVFSLILISLAFFGCTTSNIKGNLNDLKLKADLSTVPEINSFLLDFPTAEMTVVLLDANQVAEMLLEIESTCGIKINFVEDFYYVSIKSSSMIMKSWVRESNKKLVCFVKQPVLSKVGGAIKDAAESYLDQNTDVNAPAKKQIRNRVQNVDVNNDVNANAKENCELNSMCYWVEDANAGNCYCSGALIDENATVDVNSSDVNANDTNVIVPVVQDQNNDVNGGISPAPVVNDSNASCLIILNPSKLTGNGDINVLISYVEMPRSSSFRLLCPGAYTGTDNQYWAPVIGSGSFSKTCSYYAVTRDVNRAISVEAGPIICNSNLELKAPVGWIADHSIKSVTANDLNVDVNQEITVSVIIFNAGNSTVAGEWYTVIDFGDGQQNLQSCYGSYLHLGESPLCRDYSHSYSQKGNYQISARVIDDAGNDINSSNNFLLGPVITVN